MGLVIGIMPERFFSEEDVFVWVRKFVGEVKRGLEKRESTRII